MKWKCICLQQLVLKLLLNNVMRYSIVLYVFMLLTVCSVHCEVSRTRLSSIRNCIQPRKLLLMSGHLAASVTATVCLMKLAGQDLAAFSLKCLDSP